MNNRPHIPQTRSSQYRPMTQMNGDFLTQLKKPICSELNADVSMTSSAMFDLCIHVFHKFHLHVQFCSVICSFSIASFSLFSRSSRAPCARVKLTADSRWVCGTKTSSSCFASSTSRKRTCTRSCWKFSARRDAWRRKGMCVGSRGAGARSRCSLTTAKLTHSISGCRL